MDKPLVSIVIPVYNAEQFLGYSLSDIIKQTYRNFELICINDGSTDQTEDLLRDYEKKDHRIKVLTQSNQGAGSARNMGIKAATGKYIIFLDADDRFDENLLEISISEAEKLNLDICIFDARCFDDNLEVELKSDWILRKDLLPNKEVFSYKDCARVIQIISPNIVWNKLYRRNFLIQNQLFFQNVSYMNDVWFVQMGLIKAKRIGIVNTKLVLYRQGNIFSITSLMVRQRDPKISLKVMNGLKESLIKEGVYEDVKYGHLINQIRHFTFVLETSSASNFVSFFELVKAEVLKDKIEYSPAIEEDIYEKYNHVISDTPCEYAMYLMDRFREAFRWQYVESLYFQTNKWWVYDSSYLKKGDRIVLYGAGDVGVDYYHQLLREEKVNIVAWVDRNYQELVREAVIQSPECIYDIEFDYVIIAVLNSEAKKAIIDNLINKISKDKIR